MFQIDVMSRIPIYEQLVTQMERFILSGVLAADDQIPSVRSLSVELSVNPNTIQKAYGEVDRRGLTYAVPGKGSFVCPDAAEKIRASRRSRLKDLNRMVEDLRMAGITREEILTAVDQAFEGGVKE